MIHEPILSLAEITALERSFTLGAPTLDLVARALGARWRAGLRDEDTLARIAAVGHVARSEPGWTRGGADALPTLDRFVDAAEARELPPETAFVVGQLLVRTPDLAGAGLAGLEGEELIDRAAERCPASVLFAVGRFFAGDRELEIEVVRVRPQLRRELHARFAGRGLLGERIRPEWLRAVNQAGRQPRLG